MSLAMQYGLRAAALAAGFVVVAAVAAALIGAFSGEWASWLKGVVIGVGALLACSGALMLGSALWNVVAMVEEFPDPRDKT